jgi:hypothetical protein
MGQWNWNQPGIGTWKVISDHDKGTITIFDENGDLIIEKSGLNKEALEIIEKNFFDLVANTDNNGSNKNNSLYA